VKIDGACHCGKIGFEAEVNPENVLICHCTDCQTLSGSAYRTVVPVTGNEFRLVSGTPKIYIKTAQDGTPRTQAFCPDCGTPIYAGPVESASGMLGIRVGAIRQRAQLAPQKQYYCQSAQDWVQDLSAVTRIET
jgi:hypothetical protein